MNMLKTLRNMVDNFSRSDAGKQSKKERKVIAKSINKKNESKEIEKVIAKSINKKSESKEIEKVKEASINKKSESKEIVKEKKSVSNQKGLNVCQSILLSTPEYSNMISKNAKQIRKDLNFISFEAKKEANMLIENYENRTTRNITTLKKQLSKIKENFTLNEMSNLINDEKVKMNKFVNEVNVITKRIKTVSEPIRVIDMENFVKQQKLSAIEKYNECIKIHNKYITDKNISKLNLLLDNIKWGKAFAALQKIEVNRMTKNVKFLGELEEERIKEKRRELSNKSKIDSVHHQYRRKFDISALNGAFREITIENDHFNVGKGILNIDLIKHVIEMELTKALNQDPNHNVFANVIFQYKKMKNDDEVEGYFHSKISQKIISKPLIKDYAKETVDGFVAKTDELLESVGSGWVFQGLDNIRIQMMKSKKTRSGTFLETPNKLFLKHAIVNIESDDEQCIKHALNAFLNYDNFTSKHKYHAKNYEKCENQIKMPKGITFPIDILSDIPKIEKENKMKINVFNYDPKDVDYKNLLTIYNTMTKLDNVCNLLVIPNGEKDHIVWIRNLGRLLRKEGDNKNQNYWCSQCLTCSYLTKEQLDNHQVSCFKNEAVHCIMPIKFDPTKVDKKGNVAKAQDEVKFVNHNNKFKHPVSVYLDFESTLLSCKNHEANFQKPENNGKKHEVKTTKYQKHKCNSVGIKFNCIHSEYSKPIEIFSNDNSEEVLKFTVEKLEEYAEYSYGLIKSHEKKIIISDEQKKDHEKALICLSCSSEFSKENKKVLHHDHVNGQYISTICATCNLNYKYKMMLPVSVHNLGGYDAHFLVPALNSYGYKNNKAEILSAIPNNEEKYISFSKTIKVGDYSKEGQKKDILFEIRFIDTIGFMAESLSSLVDNLKSGGKNIKEHREIFKNVSDHYTNDKDFELMLEKGIYPYDYITSFEKLKDTKLPPIKAFYSKLADSKCDPKDYKKALKVWKHFKCKTLLDYHNIYLISDVLLLADVFENFKATCYKIYGLDPSYYYTAPGLSWDAFLKHTTEDYKKRGKGLFKLQLLTDLDMYLFVESGIRGGLSQISKRYAKANNKYMKNYNPKQMDEYILYLDANNLYGYAMLKYLPRDNFHWSLEQWTDAKVLAMPDDGENGALIEVDLEYPEHLHNLHNGYALACDNQTVKIENLNDWQKEGYNESNIQKLLTSFEPKKNYVVNYRLLKLFINQGLKVTAYHKVLEYTQDNYLASYIMKNTVERTKAKNEFDKNFYKLCNNSAFGKTMESVRNRINFRLISSEASALAVRNTRIKYTIFNENLVGLHLCKQQVRLNKPIYIGQTVLDDSKNLMVDFHYNTMLKKFDTGNIELLFTDTDSLCYHIKNQDPFKMMQENRSLFDLSNYPEDHFMYDATNKKVVAKFKNESWKQILEFVGLRSKLYAYTTEEDQKPKHLKSKVVNYAAIKNQLKFQNYKHTLFNRKSEQLKCKGVKYAAVKNQLKFKNCINTLSNRKLEHLKCKGVKYAAVKNQLKFQNYKHTLFNRESKTITQNTFRSHGHQMYTETVSKTGLSYNDDKTYVCDDNIHCLTFGHKNIKK